MQEVQEEGKYAIDSPGNPVMVDVPPEEYTLGTKFAYLPIKVLILSNNIYNLILKRKMKNALWWNPSLILIPNYKN